MPPLLGTLERVEWVQRHLYPPLAGRLADQLAPGADALAGPLAPVFEPVSRWFLEPARRHDDALVARLSAAALRDDGPRVGVLHASNAYALLCGLRDGMPFTHLAPACGVLHPVLLAAGDLTLARGRPIYLVHGTLDWMFPVDTARRAREALLAAGARLVYREIADLSHAYPRDENPKILDWLMAD